MGLTTAAEARVKRGNDFEGAHITAEGAPLTMERLSKGSATDQTVVIGWLHLDNKRHNNARRDGGGTVGGARRGTDQLNVKRSGGTACAPYTMAFVSLVMFLGSVTTVSAIAAGRSTWLSVRNLSHSVTFTGGRGSFAGDVEVRLEKIATERLDGGLGCDRLQAGAGTTEVAEMLVEK